MSNPNLSPAAPSRFSGILRHVLVAVAALAVVGLAVGVHMAMAGLIVVALGHLAVAGLAYLALTRHEAARSARQ